MAYARGFTMRLHPEHFAEYVRRHDDIWPELTSLLSNAGIFDYSIFVDDAHETLFGTFKYRDQALLEALPNHPIMQRWWEHMAPLMVTNVDNSPVQSDLAQIFVHDPQMRGDEDPFDPVVLRRIRDNYPEPHRVASYTASNGKERPIAVFRPANIRPDVRLPGLVLFHGGGWRTGTPQDIARQAYLISQLGVVVFTPGYAVAERDDSTPRDSLADAFLAWNSICSRADELGFDQSRLATGGSSAGGHLASALANLESPMGLAPTRRPDLLLLFEAVIDNGPDGYGFDRVHEYWQSFSPLHNIAPSHPTTLLIAGENDDLLPPITAERYRAAVCGTGAICELEVFPGADHGWFQRAGFEVTTKSALNFLTRHFV